MNVHQLKKVVKHGYKIGRPVCSLSSPGLGKSSIIFQCCEEFSKEYGMDFGMIEIRGASSSPSELAAIKYVDTGSVLEAEQSWVPTKEKVEAGICPERGIIFCDEISSSLPAVVSTLQRLFLDRKLGGLTLADGWYVTAAGNRAKDKSAATNLSRAFLNRCIVVTVDPDPDVFWEWGLEFGIDYRVLAFVRFVPECVQDGIALHRNDNQAFCSPRSLEIVSDILSKNGAPPQDLLPELLTGTLGDGVGSTMLGFLSIMDSLPDVKNIINNPTTAQVPHEANVIYATIGALMGRLDDKNYKNICTYFTRLPTELSTIAIKDAGSRCEVFKLDAVKEWSVDNLRFAS